MQTVKIFHSVKVYVLNGNYVTKLCYDNGEVKYFMCKIKYIKV